MSCGSAVVPGVGRPSQAEPSTDGDVVSPKPCPASLRELSMPPICAGCEWPDESPRRISETVNCIVRGRASARSTPAPANSRRVGQARSGLIEQIT